RRHAQIVLAVAAAHACTTADPRAHQAILAYRNAAGLRSSSEHRPVGFVAEGVRQLHATLGHVEALATSQLEVAVTDMHVAMAYATILELEQHLGAGRPGRLAGGRLQGFAPFCDVVAEHGASDQGRC